MIRIAIPRRLSGSARRGTSTAAPRGFTLLEMLIVTLVVALLATTVLVAMLGVTEEGKKARARSQIHRINQLLMTRWEGYLARPVPLRLPPQIDSINSARMRLTALHDLMRLEMPDRINDVTDDPVVQNYGGDPYFIDLPTVTRAYRRQATPGWTEQHQGAECLYMILSQLKDGNSSGLDYFRGEEIGDVDGDGMKEILDPWGVPITFVRWPAGFTSPIQSRNGAEQPDPFDPLQVRAIDGEITYQLHPLVASAGPDSSFNILADVQDGDENTVVQFSQTTPPCDPYASFIDDTGAPRQLAEILDPNADGHLDNFTNHILDLD